MQDYDEKDLIDSALNQAYTKNGKSVEIHIYRMPNASWILEVVDSFGNSMSLMMCLLLTVKH